MSERTDDDMVLVSRMWVAELIDDYRDGPYSTAMWATRVYCDLCDVANFLPVDPDADSDEPPPFTPCPHDPRCDVDTAGVHDPWCAGIPTPGGDGARPLTLLGLARDHGCGNFTDADNGHHNRSAPVGYCLTNGGRSVLARDGADRACWPCTIAALLDDGGGA